MDIIISSTSQHIGLMQQIGSAAVICENLQSRLDILYQSTIIQPLVDWGRNSFDGYSIMRLELYSIGQPSDMSL